ncbi:MAG: HEAT repeat domain-containing protein [Candidatus Micrarchaeota archaeon]
MVEYLEWWINELIEALKDKSWSVRESAENRFVKIGKRAVEPLINALKDEEWQVRWYAAEALGKLGDVSAIEPLIEVLKNEKWCMGERAIETLRKMYMRGAVAEALGKIAQKLILADTGPLDEKLMNKIINVLNEALTEEKVDSVMRTIQNVCKEIEKTYEKQKQLTRFEHPTLPITFVKGTTSSNDTREKGRKPQELLKNQLRTY